MAGNPTIFTEEGEARVEAQRRLGVRQAPVSASRIERDMLAYGMKAMVRAWVTRDGMDHFDRACYGGVSVEDAVGHYSKTMKAAQRNNPTIRVGRADAIDLLTGESHRVGDVADPR